MSQTDELKRLDQEFVRSEERAASDREVGAAALRALAANSDTSDEVRLQAALRLLGPT